MLDFKKIFVDSASKKRLIKRGVREEELALIEEYFNKNLELVKRLNELRHKKNQLNPKQGNAGEATNAEALLLKQQIAVCSKKKQEIANKLQEMCSKIPNLPTESTPLENVIVDLTEYHHDLSHVFTYEQIIKKINFIDEKGSTALSGNKFVVYNDFASRLLRALINFSLHENSKRGYLLKDTPYLVYKNNLFNTGQLPKFEEDLYKLSTNSTNDLNSYYLTPTAEVPLTNLFQQQTFSREQLPIKITSHSPCFRAEAGAAGQKDKGLIRLHQFHKVEIVQITTPEASNEAFEEMITTARNILHKLKITHRVVELSYTELGFSAAKGHDLEIWFPNSKEWRELSSGSNCGDFQTRRANIKVADANTKRYAHSLNCSSIAIDRLMAVLLEYYYNPSTNEVYSKLPECLKNFFVI